MTSLHLDYLPMDQIAARPAAWWRNVLGVVGFTRPPDIESPTVPVTASMTPSLGTGGDLCEVWRVAGDADLELANGVPSDLPDEERVHYRFCEDLLFGSVTIAERASGDSDSLSQATISAYGRIFEVLERTAHPHLIRVWNYLPEINRAAGGDERYRHFNSARREAFHASGRPTKVVVPAASALGSPAGSPISIYFLATRDTAEDDRESAPDERLSLPAEVRGRQSELLESVHVERVRRDRSVRLRHGQHRRL